VPIPFNAQQPTRAAPQQTTNEALANAQSADNNTHMSQVTASADPKARSPESQPMSDPSLQPLQGGHIQLKVPAGFGVNRLSIVKAINTQLDDTMQAEQGDEEINTKAQLSHLLNKSLKKLAVQCKETQRLNKFAHYLQHDKLPGARAGSQAFMDLKHIAFGLDNYCESLSKVDPEIKAEMLLHFPPQESEFECLDGTRGRLGEINAFLTRELSSNSDATDGNLSLKLLIKKRLIPNTVSVSVQKALNRRSILSSMSRAYHIHAPTSAKILLGGNENMLKKADGYALDPLKYINANQAYGFQQDVPNLVSQELNELLQTGEMNQVIQEFNELMAWTVFETNIEPCVDSNNQPLFAVQNKYADSVQGLKANALYCALLENQIVATDQEFMVENQHGHYVLDTSKLQTQIDELLIKHFNLKPIRDINFLSDMDGQAVDYKNIVDEGSLQNRLMPSLTSDDSETVLQALDMLDDMQNQKLNQALSSPVMTYFVISNIAQYLQLTPEAMLNDLSNKFPQHELIQNKISELAVMVHEMDNDQAAQYLKPVMQSQKTILTGPQQDNIVYALTHHKLPESMVRTVMNNLSTAGKINCFQHVLHIIENSTPGMANIDAITDELIRQPPKTKDHILNLLAQKPKVTHYMAQKAFARNDVNFLSQIINNPKTFASIADKERCFPVWAEAWISNAKTYTSPEMIELIDSTQWPGKLKYKGDATPTLKNHNPLSIAIGNNSVDRIKHWIKTKPELMQRHIEFINGSISNSQSMQHYAIECVLNSEINNELVDALRPIFDNHKSPMQLMGVKPMYRYFAQVVDQTRAEKSNFKLAEAVLSGRLFKVKSSSIFQDKRKDVRDVGSDEHTRLATVKSTLINNAQEYLRSFETDPNANPSEAQKEQMQAATQCIEILRNQGY